MDRSLPAKLYKYQPYNVQTLDNLKNRVLWFSKPAQFNDPFDCKIVPAEVGGISAADWNALHAKARLSASAAKKTLPFPAPDGKFKAAVKEAIETAFENIVATLQERGVACFSARMDDILMWSHYADGHRGFCLEFDTSYEPLSKARPVLYAEAFPVLEASEAAEIVVGGKPDLLASFRFTKSSNWSYEQEWRVFHLEGGREYPFEAAALTGIYLGCAMPFVHQEVVARLLAGYPTRLYEMKQSETQFKVEARLVKS